MYSLTDPLRQAGPMPPFLVYGPNMAIRTAVFQSGVRFDPSIGPRSSSYYAMGSETELTIRLSRQGYKAWYVPSAVVEHFIRDKQLHKSWVLKRAIRYGRGCFRLGNVEKKYGGLPLLFGVPRTYFRQICGEEKSIIKAWLMSDERELLSACWRRNCLWGQMVEAYLRHRRRATM
jgi:GT2 family glycosyltransferase